MSRPQTVTNMFQHVTKHNLDEGSYKLCVAIQCIQVRPWTECNPYFRHRSNSMISLFYKGSDPTYTIQEGGIPNGPKMSLWDRFKISTKLVNLGECQIFKNVLVAE